MDNNNLYLNTIGICVKAHKYSFGDTLLYDIRAKKVFLVIIALDAGASSSKKVTDKCNYYSIDCVRLLSKDDMKYLFNKNISSFGITDANLAKKLKENLLKREA